MGGSTGRKSWLVYAVGAFTLLTVILRVTQRLDPFPQGLNAEYFSNPTWTSPPAMSGIDSEPSASRLLEAWHGSPPANFSVAWAGSIVIVRGGTYTFGTVSDDGSWVFVDGQLVVDNGGRHAPRLATGSIDLTGGPHHLLIRYFQAGGGLHFELLWAHGGSRMEPVPPWALRLRRARSLARVVPSVLAGFTLVAINWLWVGILGTAGAAGSWALVTRVRRSVALQRRIPILVAGISTIVLMARFFWLINRDAVNILLYDQWDVYFVYGLPFDRMAWWAMFDRQFGAIRLGLGMWFTAVVAALSGWNARVEAFAIGGAVALAMGLALLLKRWLFGRWSGWDVCIPLIFLTLSQYAQLTVVPFPSHSPVPLLLVMLYVFAWTIPRPFGRYAAVLALNFALIYTAFAIFMGPLTIALLGLESAQQTAERKWTQAAHSATALLIAALSLASFFWYGVSDGGKIQAYEFAPTIGCFRFPHDRPLEYLSFISLMFARFVGAELTSGAWLATLIGSGLLAVLVATLVYRGQALVRHDVAESHLDRSVTLLVGFTLLFCANTAIGRVCLGVQAGQASRYMTLLTPGLFGLYLHLLAMQWPRLRATALALLLAVLVPVPLPGRSDDAAQSAGWKPLKEGWKNCYLREGSIEQCNTAMGFQVYPDASLTAQRLAYLREHRLNLFLDEP